MRNNHIASGLLHCAGRWAFPQPANFGHWSQIGCIRRSFHAKFKAGDSVLLKAQGRDDRSFWIGALREDGMFESHQGNIPHEQIIGRASRERVASSAGKTFSMHWPTLAEHCVMTPRVVTPIYPAECVTIVSLLDIHVATTPIGEDGDAEDSMLEILEAGTGHGALTLYLARAIHAANPGIPPCMYLKDNEALLAEKAGISPEDVSSRGGWKKRRGAVVHSLDINRKHLKTAKRTVRTFGRGLYANNVDFHLTDVSSFIKAEFQQRQSTRPFLSKVVLDMPDAHTQLPNVCKAMRPNATVVVFCPQVTQILDAVKITKRLKLPLILEQVVELGMGMSGGRQWDVRVTPRRAPASSEVATKVTGTLSFLEKITHLIFGHQQTSADDADPPDAWFEVCKPKLGEKIVNGGFIGVWTKTEPMSA